MRRYTFTSSGMVENSTGEWLRLSEQDQELYLFRWMVNCRFTVQESPFFNYPHGNKWEVICHDGQVIARGENAVKALQKAHDRIDNPTDEEAQAESERLHRENDNNRADELRDREKDDRRELEQFQSDRYGDDE